MSNFFTSVARQVLADRDRLGFVRSALLYLTLPHIIGRRLHGFLGLSLNDRTIISLVILLDKTVSEG